MTEEFKAQQSAERMFPALKNTLIDLFSTAWFCDVTYLTYELPLLINKKIGELNTDKQNDIFTSKIGNLS
ncbi:MAG: hypothetical protein LUQ38_02060 [Methanotrichaceae archaeon]|nr:hypothetical protein [Methanotrichaceae archaeon]